MTSAAYLVRKHELPHGLRPQAERLLARALSLDPDCRRPHEEAGTRLDAFRLSKSSSDKAARTLKYLRIAEEHSASHPSDAVRACAEKVIRGFRSGRASWDQVETGLAEMRSLVTRTGRKRSRTKPVGSAEEIAGHDGKIWRRVLTVDRLERIGTEHGLCTAPSHPQSSTYARDLRSGAKQFYELTGKRGAFLGLVSIENGTVDEARGPGNALLKGVRRSIACLIKATGVAPGECDDLLAIGIANEFLDADLAAPNAQFADLRLWKSEQGSILVESKGAWSVLRALDQGVFYGRGRLDVDNVLGTVLSAIVDCAQA